MSARGFFFNASYLSFSLQFFVACPMQISTTLDVKMESKMQHLHLPVNSHVQFHLHLFGDVLLLLQAFGELRRGAARNQGKESHY